MNLPYLDRLASWIDRALIATPTGRRRTMLELRKKLDAYDADKARSDEDAAKLAETNAAIATESAEFEADVTNRRKELAEAAETDRKAGEAKANESAAKAKESHDALAAAFKLAGRRVKILPDAKGVVEYQPNGDGFTMVTIPTIDEEPADNPPSDPGANPPPSSGPDTGSASGEPDGPDPAPAPNSATIII